MPDISDYDMPPIASAQAASVNGVQRLWRRRWVRWLTWIIVAMLALLLLLWQGAPPLAKWQGQKIATEKLGRPVSIGAVEFRPWSLELTLRDVAIGGAKADDPPQLAVRRLYANVALASVFQLAPIVEAIEVDGPALRLRHLGDGRYDADDVIARLTSGPKDDKPVHFALYNIVVQDGRVTFIDDPVQGAHEVRDLRLTLPFVSNLPSHLKARVTPQLAFSLDGSRFDSSTQTLPFDPSRHTEARFRLERLDLAPYLAYQPASLPLRVTAGALDADLRVTFEEMPTPSLKIAGAANLFGVKVNDATGQAALAFERLAVDVNEVRPLEQLVHLASVELTAPHVLASRDAKGRINWMPASSAPEKPAAARRPSKTPAKPAGQPAADSSAAAPPSPANSANDWRVTVDRVGIAQGNVQWRDQQPAAGAVEVALSQLNLEVREFELGGSKPVPLELSAQLAPRRGKPGTLAWRGAVGIAPVSAQGEVDAERLPLHAFEPYVTEQLNIDILRADASFKGKVDYVAQSAGPRVDIAGDARIEDLRTTSHPGSAAANDAEPNDAEANASAAENAEAKPAQSAKTPPPKTGIAEELLNWKQLRVTGLQVQLAPHQAPQVTVKNSQLSDFFARIIVHPNGRINLQDLLKTAAAAEAPAEPATTPAASSANAPVMRFGPTRLINGRVSFTDHFIKPNYSADLTKLNGSLSAFNSVTDPQAPQMADLQLSGQAQGTAHLAINGKLNPLAQPLALDIAAKMTDLELPPLSAYSIKYSGHAIERGKLSMDVTYKIAPDGQLTATNKLVLNQLRFGEEVPGAPASLPVSLATALLADSNGVIDLDLPISGSLNDPQFSVGPIIFKAIVNLIGKAITAPFTLLARAFSGSDEDLSHVPFAPGSATLSDAAKAQLDKVAKAMADRPQLKLTVAGAARLEEEREGFKRERLKALVAAERRPSAGKKEEPAADAASEAAPETSTAETGSDAADYPQLLQRLYRRADLPGKPRNLIGMAKEVPVPEMEALLLTSIKVSEDDIRQLAAQRAVAVKDYLLAQHLSAERVFIGTAKTANAAAAEPANANADAPAPAASPWTPHAALELGTR